MITDTKTIEINSKNYMRSLYKAKGYSDEWIENRLQRLAMRAELIAEIWQSPITPPVLSY
jgi:hypothetical protein